MKLKNFGLNDIPIKPKHINSPNKNIGIGLMTGTSLDALDICLASFTKEDQEWSYDILKSASIDFPKLLKTKLKNARSISVDEYIELHDDLGIYYAEACHQFIKEINVNPQWIACHGQTILHNPEKGFSIQLGNLARIAGLTKLPVVGDFRNVDMALGGQGAPLVPVGEKYLFPDYDAFINLGGICNIGIHRAGESKGYDITGCNLVMNSLANQLNLDYDIGGKHAAQGKLNPDFLEILNSADYFNQPAPKSLDAQWVEKNQVMLCLNSGLEVSELLRTFVEHIAIQIAKALDLEFGEKSASILVSGGGAHNSFLVERIISNCNSNIIIPESELIDNKEALIFAFLGLLRIRSERNTFASITGAREDSIGGCLYRVK